MFSLRIVAILLCDMYVCLGASSKPTKKRSSGAVRGGNNGKLLPGEKKRLKKEKMNAKRAARSAIHGLDLEAVNAELIQFVAADGDMKVCHALLWNLQEQLQPLPCL